ncbi:MAG: SoxR reducing system RseC family protein [Bacteroidales bacterium]
MSKTIEHIGIVKQLREGYADILIIQNSACSGCHAKSACTAADSAEKIIEVPYFDNDLRLNQQVTVVGSKTMGWKAVGYAFILPFLLLMIVLIIVVEQTGDELMAGLSALAVLIPYYLILYLLRNKMKSNFTFTLKK